MSIEEAEEFDAMSERCNPLYQFDFFCLNKAEQDRLEAIAAEHGQEYARQQMNGR